MSMNVNEEICRAVDKLYSDLCEKPGRGLKIKTVYVNKEKKTVAVKFVDGTTQKVSCSPEDTFDIQNGIALCIAAKAYGSKTQLKKALAKVKVVESESKTKLNEHPGDRVGSNVTTCRKKPKLEADSFYR